MTHEQRLSECLDALGEHLTRREGHAVITRRPTRFIGNDVWSCECGYSITLHEWDAPEHFWKFHDRDVKPPKRQSEPVPVDPGAWTLDLWHGEGIDRPMGAGRNDASTARDEMRRTGSNTLFDAIAEAQP